jgi:hypothetical protein
MSEEQCKRLFDEYFEHTRRVLAGGGFQRGKALSELCGVLAGLKIELHAAHRLIHEQHREIEQNKLDIARLTVELAAYQAKAKSFGHPIARWRGTYTDDLDLEPGDLLTDRGGLFVATTHTKGFRPHQSPSSFHLICKRGAFDQRDAA